MQGIELSRAYFEAYGLPMLRERFPELLSHVAAGVCGQGSENFGFDDEISRDHDFDPGFFLWLPEELYRQYEFRLSRAYDSLPDRFMDVPLQGKSVYENARHGVRCIERFFEGLIGFSDAPPTPADWLRVPSFRYACAVNGGIFYDGSGEVTALRARLSHPPADVLYKKLATAAVFAAQSGQYNFPRLLKHGEPGAAMLAAAEFVRQVCELLHLLNGRWCPFYKWALRSAKNLPALGELAAEAERLLLEPPTEESIRRIESISAALIAEFRKRGLSDHPADFLEPHAFEIAAKIADPTLRAMHIMEDGK